MNWLNRTPAFPLPYYCLCVTEAEYLRAVKHLKIKSPPEWLSNGGHGTTHTFQSNGKLSCVVCISIPKGKSKGEVYGLIIHEAVHVWQQYCDAISESSPSTEFEAYTIQAIAQALLFAFDEKTLDRRA